MTELHALVHALLLQQSDGVREHEIVNSIVDLVQQKGERLAIEVVRASATHAKNDCDNAAVGESIWNARNELVELALKQIGIEQSEND